MKRITSILVAAVILLTACQEGESGVGGENSTTTTQAAQVTEATTSYVPSDDAPTGFEGTRLFAATAITRSGVPFSDFLACPDGEFEVITYYKDGMVSVFDESELRTLFFESDGLLYQLCYELDVWYSELFAGELGVWAVGGAFRLTEEHYAFVGEGTDTFQGRELAFEDFEDLGEQPRIMRYFFDEDGAYVGSRIIALTYDAPPQILEWLIGSERLRAFGTEIPEGAFDLPDAEILSYDEYRELYSEYIQQQQSN